MNALPALTRRGAIVLFAALFAGGLAPSTSGQSLGSDDFESYATGELSGQNGGSGWSGAWTAVASVTEVVAPDPALLFATNDGRYLDGGSRAVQISGNDDNALYRTLATPLTLDTVYVSFLTRLETGTTLEDNDFASFWYDNATTGAHQGNPSIGLKANQGAGTGTADITARVQQNPNAVFAQDLTVGETYLVVGRLRKDPLGAGNNYTRFDLWVNPQPGDSTAPQATSADPGLLTSLPYFGLRSVNLAANDVVLYDQIRKSATWAGVYTDHLQEIDTGLPVELTRFEARVDGSAATLAWATASETNNDGFHVEHRPPGGAFEAVGFVDGAGTTLEAQVYRHRLAHLAPGTHAFRLRQVDADGGVRYSATVEAEVGLPAPLYVEAWPNPFQEAATLRLRAEREQTIAASLYDALGRRVQVLYEGRLAPGLAREVRVGGTGLPAGVYLVRVEGEHSAETRRLTLLR